MKCTCGPHPHIDLTAAYSSYHRSGGSGGGGGIGNREYTNKIITSCRQKIQEACKSHGCFHVTISLPDNNDGNTDISKLPIDCLSKPTKDIEEDIESLFIPKFLNNVIHQQPSTAHIDCKKNIHDDICNGGLVEVSFPTTTILPTATHKNSGTTTSATFRGRVAESGEEEESKPEPKLSWEYRRCALGDETTKNTAPLQQKNTSTTQPNDMHDGISKDSDTAEGERDTSKDEQCTLMPSWIEALHSVASTIIHLLGIPPELALQEESCQCLSTNTNIDTNHNTCQRCNIDLLRVFRYDAIPPPHDSHNQNDGKNNEPQVMGSSPHSDWGTLTIVWQDNKGGLQTYCHACDVWSDVDASSTAAEDTTTDKCGESFTANKNRSSNRKCSLFVHIGDFLSLASINSEEGNDDCYPNPMWPSPRHRVLCPPIQQENNTTSEDNSEASAKDCRRSLVYFAYPPPNISLDTVQKVVSPISFSNDSSIQYTTTTNLNDKESSINEFYNHYSLLHNQSKQSSSLAEEKDTSSMKEMKEDTDEELSAFQAYQTMKNLSFDKVIKDKWNQVQR